jgi:hypothetical protein
MQQSFSLVKVHRVSVLIFRRDGYVEDCSRSLSTYGAEDELVEGSRINGERAARVMAKMAKKGTHQKACKFFGFKHIGIKIRTFG